MLLTNPRFIQESNIFKFFILVRDQILGNICECTLESVVSRSWRLFFWTVKVRSLTTSETKARCISKWRYFHIMINILAWSWHEILLTIKRWSFSSTYRETSIPFLNELKWGLILAWSWNFFGFLNRTEIVNPNSHDVFWSFTDFLRCLIRTWSRNCWCSC